jgi:hypothetical protein
MMPVLVAAVCMFDLKDPGVETVRCWGETLTLDKKGGVYIEQHFI